MKKYLIILALLTGWITVSAQVKLDWEQLTDVKYNEQYSEELGSYTNVPVFGSSVKALSNKVVEISGYVIPLDVKQDLYVLSANPYATCFFCGGAGPETVMDLKFVKIPRKFRTDEKIRVKGVLKLNATDIYQLTYILDKAVLVK
ncbi:MAG TPA: DUF3299 domain-containing protein [Luteibaculaceae bacterium]|nr:DUF3299 domain-containing protein [Luteibaculaceae bacterium]